MFCVKSLAVTAYMEWHVSTALSARDSPVRLVLRVKILTRNGSESSMGIAALFLGKKMHTQHRLKVWGLEKECGELLRARRLCLAVSALFGTTRHTVAPHSTASRVFSA